MTIDRWLDYKPHALVPLAIFDMHRYEPTHSLLQGHPTPYAGLTNRL